jgi:hypothetical protein
VFANQAPIIFYSKKQGSIETGSFGSEFSALKTAAELVEGLHYKLRMMGCPLDGPTCMFADNMSIVHHCSKPESTLKKKWNSIAFYCVRSLCATSPSPTMFVVWIKSEDNPADMFTKNHAGPVRMRLAKMVLFR